MKKARNGFVKNLRYLCLTGVMALGLVTIIGTGGGGGGGSGGGSEGGNETAPEIYSVELTDEDFNPKSEFNIGDKANFLVTAIDPDKNMEELIVEQYYPHDSEGNPYYGPDSIGLPSQTTDVVTFYLIGGTDVAGPAGNWRIEFQIVDSTGLESNVFRVYAVIHS